MKRLLRFLRLKYIGRALRIRTLFYSILFGSFGSDSYIQGRILVKKPENIYVGSKVGIDFGCVINARNKITIGDNVMLSAYVIINSGGLDYTKKGEDRNHKSAPVNIGDGVWIGSGAIINPGVTIGENSVIGAGSVVTKDIPPNVVAVGVPARVIKNIEFIAS